MLSPSAPPLRKTCTRTLLRGTAVSARRASSDEGWAPTPRTARPAPLRKMRRESSQLIASSPLHLRAGQDEGGHFGQGARPLGGKAVHRLKHAIGQAVPEDLAVEEGGHGGGPRRVAPVLGDDLGQPRDDSLDRSFA